MNDITSPGSSVMRPLGYLIFAAFTAVAAAGCPTGQLTSPSGPSVEGAPVPILQEGEQAASGQQTQAAALTTVEADKPLPAAFPRDVPVYTRGRISDSADEGDGFFVAVETNDPTASVLSFYHGRLRQSGWRIDPYADPIDPNVLMATKDDRLLMMACRQVENGTRVLLSISYPDLAGG